MVNRTWIGGGNNKADNPKDWSPTGAPPAGDVLTMNSGTMNASGSSLFSDNLNIISGTFNGKNIVAANLFLDGDTIVNLSNNSSATVDVIGNSKVNIQDNATVSLTAFQGGLATVNLAANSHWIGDFHVNPGGSLVVNGDRHATFINSGSSGIAGVGAHAVINADITGGSSLLAVGGGATLELNGSVAPGITVVVTSGALAPTDATSVLKIDHPGQFSGILNLGVGEIDLVGLAKADSYSFKNDMLSIYSGKGIIDTLSLQQGSGIQAGSPFVVEKTATGVSIYSLSDPTHPAGKLLPLHA